MLLSLHFPIFENTFASGESTGAFQLLLVHLIIGYYIDGINYHQDTMAVYWKILIQIHIFYHLMFLINYWFAPQNHSYLKYPVYENQWSLVKHRVSILHSIYPTWFILELNLHTLDIDGSLRKVWFSTDLFKRNNASFDREKEMTRRCRIVHGIDIIEWKPNYKLIQSVKSFSFSRHVRICTT